MMGLHLLLDGMTATPPQVNDVRRVISLIVELICLHVISGPFFYNLESHQEAFAIIAESHMSVMWWENGLVLVDLFSCKPFDVEKSVDVIVNSFNLELYDYRTVERMGVG